MPSQSVDRLMLVLAGILILAGTCGCTARKPLQKPDTSDTSSEKPEDGLNEDQKGPNGLAGRNGPAQKGAKPMENLTQRQIEEIVDAYIAKKQRWPKTAYKIHLRSSPDEAGNHVIDVTHKDDLSRRDIKGGGKSIQLLLNPKSRTIVAEYGFQ